MKKIIKASISLLMIQSNEILRIRDQENELNSSYHGAGFRKILDFDDSPVFGQYGFEMPLG